VIAGRRGTRIGIVPTAPLAGGAPCSERFGRAARVALVLAAR